jgi:hypothetical protein
LIKVLGFHLAVRHKVKANLSLTGKFR